jgi:hypothetical protein
MDASLWNQIYNTLNLRETEDLLEIWRTHDTEEWQEQAFEIIEKILVERLGSVPARPSEITPTDKREPTAIDQVESGAPDLPFTFLDGKASILIGWPGYRTRPGRSGYDPLETDFEHTTQPICS